MSLFSFIGCLADKHQPVRREVDWDGRYYVGTCRHCGASIRRYAHHDWRKRED
jgi:hypothetical protein